MRSVIWAACLLLAACSLHEGSEAAAFPDEANGADADTASTFSLRGERGSVVARVGEAEIVSADLNVSRYREDGGVAMRGVAHGSPVNIDAKGGEVTGLIGAAPVNLAVSRDQQGTLLVSGLSRGNLASLRFDRTTIEGTLGGCAYDLANLEAVTYPAARYEGRRSCGGVSDHVVLRVPASFWRWREAESTAMALAVLMGPVR